MSASTQPAGERGPVEPEQREHHARDPDWYRDAVIYELHVKSFFDANNDGIGDFRGVTQKLDYLRDLGVTALWLLPFYPSPLRDDGYDIMDYKAINPNYGTMADFRRFVRAAHKRGMHVITELVINHTSDQHPWFQRARRAKRGSNARNFYVWSDTDTAYQDARIIFCDVESSNWTWDPVAQQYYWHRFFSHQPDLNFDNPQVVRAVINVMKFWLDKGVDGLRLDAVPYLVEREGTSCENLPETHQILKTLRREIDRNYQGRMLLAEANMWPEDVRPYFGDGDECHMGFHFPLMPRLYMALAQEDRHPITDILRQTPALPEGCQWAVFLRNHDELTLEMVTDRERDYLWEVYAKDRRARLNLGIRHRLAPLLDNDRRRIELLNSLLMSMPGTPVIYYGDELGMGDNIFLGDRDGVRTPMQWAPDRNGGFSRASPQRLFLPPIMDPVYGYGAVNVEAQTENPSSLLNWMRRIVAVRQNHRRTFGRGELTFLYPGNRRILAYLREGEDEIILCVANLGRAPEAVELDLRRFKGRVPVELFGRSAFPPIGDLPYLLTVPRHGFYWFVLTDEARAPEWHLDLPEPLPDFLTLILPQGAESITSRPGARGQLEAEVVPAFLNHQPWFKQGDHGPAETTRLRAITVMLGDDGRDGILLADLEVATDGTGRYSAQEQRYLLPLAVYWSEAATQPGSALLPFTLAKIRRGNQLGVLYDAQACQHFAPQVLRRIAHEDVLATDAGGEVRFRRTAYGRTRALPLDGAVERLGTSADVTSLRVGPDVAVKIYRRLHPSQAAELDLIWFLTDTAGYRNIAPLLGTVAQHDSDGTVRALGLAQDFIPNQGTGWAVAVDMLQHLLEDDAGVSDPAVRHADMAGSQFHAHAHTLGRRVAELHESLCLEVADPRFAPAPIDAGDVAAWQERARTALDAALAVAGDPDALGADGGLGAALGRLTEGRAALHARIDAVPGAAMAGYKARRHGALDLGRIVLVQNDVYIFDFFNAGLDDGAGRRDTPLADPAELLLSLQAAGWAAVAAAREKRSEDLPRLIPDAMVWVRTAQRELMDAYHSSIADSPVWPGDDAGRALLDLMLIDRASRILAEPGRETARLRGAVTTLLALAGQEEHRPGD